MAEETIEPQESPPEVITTEMPAWVPKAILLFLGGVVAIMAGDWLLTRLSDLILMVVVALFLSFALEPAVDWLARRGWRRGSATGLVLALLFVAAVLFLGAIVASTSSCAVPSCLLRAA